MIRRIGLFHRNLKRIGDSVFKSYCPFCSNGLLLMRRNEKLELELEDSCTNCGRFVLYIDVVSSSLLGSPIEYVEGDM